MKRHYITLKNHYPEMKMTRILRPYTNWVYLRRKDFLVTGAKPEKKTGKMQKPISWPQWIKDTRMQ